MSIKLDQSELQKIYFEKQNKTCSDEIDTPEDIENSDIKAPKAKDITAPLSKVLTALTGEPELVVPSGTYTVPNGVVVLHQEEDGQIGVQFVGDGGITLKELVNAIKAGNTTSESDTSAGNGINGEIDETVKQGQTGDCWLISAVLSLTATEEGKALIKAAIEVQDNGDVVVNFKGLGVSVTVSAEDIKKHDTDNNKRDAFSNGDNDMLVFELAVEKLLEEHPELGYDANGNGDDSHINGGFSSDLLSWLSGNKSKSISGFDLAKDDLDAQYDAIDKQIDDINALVDIINEQVRAMNELIKGWVTVPDSVQAYAGWELPLPKTLSYDEMFNEDKTDLSDAYYEWYNNTFYPMYTKYEEYYNEYKTKCDECDAACAKYEDDYKAAHVNGIPEEEVINLLQEAYESQPCAITFALYTCTDETVKTAKTVDGKDFTWSYFTTNPDDTGELGGHAFAVVGMTEDTITFVNPWDSSQKITMTWEEFAKLGIGSIEYTALDKTESADNPDVPDVDVMSEEEKQAVADKAKEDAKQAISELTNLTDEQKALLTESVNVAIDTYISSSNEETVEALQDALQQLVNDTINEYLEPITITDATKAQELTKDAMANAEAEIKKMSNLTSEQQTELTEKVKILLSSYTLMYTRLNQSMTISEFKEALSQIVNDTIDKYLKEIEEAKETLTTEKKQEIAAKIKEEAGKNIMKRTDLSYVQKATLQNLVYAAIDSYVQTTTEETVGALQDALTQVVNDTIDAYVNEINGNNNDNNLTTEKKQEIAAKIKEEADKDIMKRTDLSYTQKAELLNQVHDAIDTYVQTATEETAEALQDALKQVVNDTIDAYINEIDDNNNDEIKPTTIKDEIEAIKKAAQQQVVALPDLTSEQKTELLNRIDSAINKFITEYAEQFGEDVFNSTEINTTFKEEIKALADNIIMQFLDEVAAEKEAEAQKDYLDDAKIAQIRGEVAAVAYATVDEMSLSMDAREELLFALQELFESDPITTSATQFRIDLENTVNELLHEYGNDEGIPSTANTVEDEANKKFDEKQASVVENKLRAQAQKRVNSYSELTYTDCAKLLNQIDNAIKQARDYDFKNVISAEEYEKKVQERIDSAIDTYFNPPEQIKDETISGIFYNGSAKDATDEYLTNLSKIMFESGLSKTEQQALLDQITPLIEQFIEDNPGNTIDAENLDRLTKQLDEIVNTYINNVNADKLTQEKQQTIKQEVRENALTQLYKLNLPSYVIEDALNNIDRIMENFNPANITSASTYKNALQEEVNNYLATYEDERAI